jgi:hypothetical protein
MVVHGLDTVMICVFLQRKMHEEQLIALQDCKHESFIFFDKGRFIT